ncbi:MAG: HEAT repeat domain-containing protein [Chloroflexota bacterium]
MAIDREALAEWVNSLSKDSLSMLAYIVRPSIEADAFPILLDWINNDVKKQSGAIKLIGYVEGISEEEEKVRFDTLLSLVQIVYESINIRLNAMSSLLALDSSGDRRLTIAQTFVELLEDDNDDIRKFAASQLKWFAHPTLEPEILAQYNTQPQLQETLIPAIANIGTASALDKLWEIMQTHTPNSLLYKKCATSPH